MKNFCFGGFRGGAPRRGGRVGLGYASFCFLKRRCPFGDGHDRFRAKAAARGRLPPSHTYNFYMNFSRLSSLVSRLIPIFSTQKF